MAQEIHNPFINKETPSKCYAAYCPGGKQNESLMHLKDEKIVYQNVLSLNIHEEDKEGFYAKPRILNGKYNGPINDDTVYENTAYLGNKGIYPISYLLVNHQGRKFLKVDFK